MLCLSSLSALGSMMSTVTLTRQELWQIQVHSLFHCLTRPDADHSDVFGGIRLADQVTALAYIPVIWSPHFQHLRHVQETNCKHSNTRSSMGLGCAGSSSAASTAPRQPRYLRKGPIHIPGFHA